MKSQKPICRNLLLAVTQILWILLTTHTAIADQLQPLQTGQTTCYDADGAVIACAGTGQDGEIKSGTAWPNPRFTDNSIATPADLTVTDNLTGLIWTKDANLDVDKDWQQALDYIKALNSSNYLGHNDWRLPNRNELQSLVNKEQSSTAAWLNGQGFSNVITNFYWSGSTIAHSTYSAWCVNMDDGIVFDVNKIGNNFYVWPVRSGQSGSFGSLILPKTGQTDCYDAEGATIPCTGTGQDGETRTGTAWPSPRFTDNSITTPADLTVTDNLTGLIWTKNGNLDEDKDWQAALDYIKILNNSNYLGHNDWRLPNSNELESIVNNQESNQATWLNGQGFSSVQAYKYWSGSTFASIGYFGASTDYAWGVSMVTGGMSYGGKTDYYYVWPVRSGQPGLLSISPAATTFAATAAGTQSAPTAFTISNVGAAAVMVSTISITGTDASQFSAVPGGSAPCSSLTPTLAAGANCTVNVTFSPTSAGAKSANLHVISDSPIAPTLDAALNGTGVDMTPPVTTASPAGGTYSAPQIVTLTANESATIYYTLDGSTPTTGSPAFAVSPLSLTITATKTLKYFARDTAGNSEDVQSQVYTINIPIPPTADFSSSATAGNAPLSVTFSDLSSGAPTSWLWNFGDTSTSTLQNPAHTYDNPGSYTVSLTVTSAGGSDTKTKSNYITVINPDPIQPLQTGQTTCNDAAGGFIACAETGQDGESRAGTVWPNPRFTDNSITSPADLTLTDNLTGLIWTKDGNPAGNRKTWQQALDYIKTLNNSNYLGHNDWRLPNRNELKSMVNRQQSISAAWLNGQGFSNVQAGLYLSSSINTSNGSPWFVDMNYGYVYYIYKFDDYYVWPVRSGQSGSVGSLILPKTGQTECYDTTGATISCIGTGQDGETRAGAAWPSPRFTDNSINTPADLSVTDNLTGLIWAKKGSLAFGTWQQALDYIKSLNNSNYLSHNDWRLPNINELESLVNISRPLPYVWLNDQGFSDVRGGYSYYWSGSTEAGSANNAWTAYMNDGGVVLVDKTKISRFWPVRSGQPGSLGSLIVSPLITGFTATVTGSQSAPTAFTISNGSATAVTVSAISIIAADASQFSVTPGGSSPCSSLTPTLAAGASCTVNVIFSPTSAGAKSANMHVVCNSTSTPTLDALLIGTGIDITPPITTATPPGRTYSTPQTVTLTANESTTIYYTIDGVNPTIASPVYSGPISISASTTLKFFARDSAGNSETIRSVVYIIGLMPPVTTTQPLLTGQITCYNEAGGVIPCAGTGQDGETRTGVAWPTPRFADNSIATSAVLTVTDNLTGLIWSKDGNPAGVAKTWQQALDYIKALNISNYLGYNDWRLPNRNELQSLVNKQQSNPITWLYGQGFSNVLASWYWSGSTCIDGGFTDNAWIVGMHDGFVGSINKVGYSYVWPVRSGQSEILGSLILPKTGQSNCYNTTGSSISCTGTGQDGETLTGAAWPSPRFTDNSITVPTDLTVTDNLTGLLWTKNGNLTAAAMTWQQALDYIKNLNNSNYLGHNDWRLPNSNELESLVNKQQPNQATWLKVQGFSNVQANYYWSGSNNAVYTYVAWGVNMIDGSVNGSSKGNYGYVLPVRSVQPGYFGSLSLSPATTTFTATASGSQSAPTTFVIGNVGAAAVAVSTISITGTDSSQFSVTLGGSSPCSSLTPTLAAGASCTVNVIFTPTSAGAKSANLHVVSDSTITPTLDATLSGTGVDATPPVTTAFPAGGTYAAPQNVTLTANESATIYYTIDGENPTIASSVYSGPITISSATTIKFFARDNAGNIEDVKTESYIISSWTAASSMATGRESYTATLLANGKVLVAGGYNGDSLSSAELYDSATDSWIAAGSMATPRLDHTATLLPNGKVMVTGGRDDAFNPVSSAELYDPASNSWSTTGSMATARYFHTGTLLQNGKVLVAGGRDDALSPVSGAELYDPATDSWSSAGSMNDARYGHTGTLLQSGKVLVAGGADAFSAGILSSAELYDPVTDSWSLAGSLTTGRNGHVATLLQSGNVLVTGGYDYIIGALFEAELYDPATDSWSSAGSTATARYYHTATLLQSGKLLVAGGDDIDLGTTSSAELYDPATGSWSATGSMATARYGHTGTLLPDGKVLVAGGWSDDVGYLFSAELYSPITDNKQDATVTLNNLSLIYDGTAKAVTATTTPAGLTVIITYNGHPTAPVNAGSYNIVAIINDSNYQGSATGILTIERADQSITFADPPDKTYGDPQFTFSATATSGLGITYTSSDSSVASITGNIVTITGAGIAIITALQSGSDDYNPASAVSRTFTVGKATIAVNATSATRTYGTDNPIFTASYTGFVNGDGPSVVSGAPAFTSTAIKLSPVGGYPIIAEIGNLAAANYTFAFTDGVLTITRANQNINFAPLAGKIQGNPSFALTATATSGLGITYTSNNPTVATILGNIVTITGPGEATIFASQEGDANYNVAPTVSQQLTVASGIKLSGNSGDAYFATLSAAYSAATVGTVATFTLPAGQLTENLVLDKAIDVTIRGGYDATFSTVIGVTTIQGSMTIQAGSVIIDGAVSIS